MRDTGLPIILVTTRGNKSGKLRKTPLMRVEHDGDVRARRVDGRRAEASRLVLQPQGRSRLRGPSRTAPSPSTHVRELSGDERAEWWERAVAAYPPYAEYQTKTDRLIPVFVATRR